MKKSVFLSVVIPSYNEKANLERGVLNSVVSFLKKQSYDWEVVLTDDGSTDGTTEELKKFAQAHEHVKVVENPHRGKGPTVISGMLHAVGNWRLFTDFDQATPIDQVSQLLSSVKDGAQIAIGSREMVGSKREKEPFHRHIMGRVFNLIVQTLAVPGVSDTQCGFKMFSAEATKLLFPRLQIYKPEQKVRPDAFTGAFDVELLFLARKFQQKIVEVPVQWRHVHTDRVSPIKDSWRMFVDVVRIRTAELFGAYGK